MKIEKIVANNDINKKLTNISAYVILSLINKRLNKGKTIDNIIIDEFFWGSDLNVNYISYINIADEFMKNNFEGYNPSVGNSQEIKSIK